jgi:hypothetical protein
VPADYEKIRDENIARYGWDTAVLDLLGQLYSERTHFIFELIQNAEDAGATDLAFELFADRLEVRHDGRPFTDADVRGVCGVGKSGKSGDLTAIGKFGIGFKSVYAYTKTPRVYSSGEHFRIEMYVRPYSVDPLDEPASGTLFVFPFDHDTVSAAMAVLEISAALNAIQPRILLFLANIGRLRVRGVRVASSVIERSVIERSVIERSVIERSVIERSVIRRSVIRRSVIKDGAESRTGSPRHVTLSKGRGRRVEEWLVWHRQVEGLGHQSQRIEIAFRVEAANGEHRIVGCDSSPLTVFFPTEKETFLGFLIQGPYRTTPARDNIPEHDPSNQALVRETAALLADVLRELRADGLLTVEVLEALPLDTARFQPGSMFRPLFDSVREALAREELIPVARGGYGAAGELGDDAARELGDDAARELGDGETGYGAAGALKLARGAALHELLSPDQLGALYGGGRTPSPLCFAHESITQNRTPVLWRYLRDEVGIDEVTPEGIVAKLTRDFLQAQSDEWIARFYGFLFQDSALWRAPRFPEEQPGPARAKPIIRLEDGRHVAPFDALDRPAVYLPGAAGSGFPTVRRTVAAFPAARQFLEALNLAEPDVVAEVLEIILPRYNRLDIAELDPAQHDRDLECVVHAMDEAPAARRQELLARLKQTAFLIGENAATGEQRLMPPPALYQRTKDLEIYFGGNPDAWFAGDAYGPWLVQLRGMGVRQAVDVRARTPNQLGYAVIAAEFGRNERGIDGFDPEAEIDGLDSALRHPSDARSEYVWNVLLAPNRRLVAGVVERSVLASFSDSSLENVRSAIAAAAEREAWLPGPGGTFRRPAELSLDDLPPTYARDEGLAHALHMLQPVVAEASRQLGIPPEVLWGLSAHPDLVAMVERELAIRAADPRPEG